MHEKKKIAIIGSSPIALFEAIYQSNCGNEVIVFEKNDRIGGAWASIQFEDNLELELGCHIWDVDKLTYSFIEKYISDELEVLKPSPRIIFKNRSFPYDWKNNILFLKTIRHDFKSFVSGKKFIKPILFSRKYKYPKHGSIQLIRRLEKDITESNVTVHLNQNISQIAASSGGCTINDTQFDKAILTSLSAVKSIQTETESINLNFRSTVFSHIHLIIKGQLKKPISYVRVMDHQFIHRISDISHYGKQENLVLAVGIFRHKTEGLTSEELIDAIKLYCIKRGWLNQDNQIIKSFENDFEASTIDHFQIKEIQQIPNISVLRSTNFIFGLGNHVERWSKVLLT